jgi:myo-inositol-1(or 4)-monophosphatase
VPDASQLAELARIATEAVNIAGEMLRTRDPGDVIMKGDRDPATEVDYAIEHAVRDFLLAEIPDIPFLGEEDGQVGSSESGLVWALDPIDGTVNFIHGIPLCGVSLGLIDGSQPAVGIVDLPFLNMRYRAVRGAGAFRGERRLEVARIASIDHAVVCLGDYAVGEDSEVKNAQRFSITRSLVAKVERVRMLGSAATDLAWMAEGTVTASVMLSNKPWDTMAGVLIAREAGAVVTDIDGAPHTTSSDSTIAAPPQLIEKLLRVVNLDMPQGRGHADI